MYLEHFGLRNLPFENVPDPAFFFGAGSYGRVLSRMSDSLAAGRGLMVVAGPMGAGKTTLSQKLMAGIPAGTKLVWLAEPPQSSEELLLFLVRELGLPSSEPGRVFALREIRAALLRLRGAGGCCLVVVDESHKMSDEVLEGIRLLNNLEEQATKLAQLLLLGQEEFLSRLARPELEAFRQRIAVMESLGRMDPAGVREYVRHRLSVAGGRGELFSARALEAAGLAADGIPRVTNTLCDRALEAAADRGAAQVEVEDVHAAAEGMGLGRKTFHFLQRIKAESATAPPPAVPPAPVPPAAASPPAAARVVAAPQPPADATLRRIVPQPTSAAPPAPLLGPALLLVAALLACAASLAFYCGRSGTGDPATCLSALLRSPF